MSEIKNNLVKVLKSVTGKHDLDNEMVLKSNFQDLGINSLSFIKIIVAIEEEFDIEFDDNQVNYELLGSVENLASLIEKMILNKA